MATLIQKTVLDRIEILSNGVVQICLLNQVINGDTVIASVDHRMALAPGDDAAAQLLTVNANLSDLGAEGITADEWSKVTAQCTAAWTESVVAAYKASLTAQNA